MANTIKKLKKQFVPYTGSEPYVFFFFSEKDAPEASKILSELYTRKIRTCYSPEKTKGIAEAEQKQKLMNSASVAVLYLTENAVNDASLKSDYLYLSSRKKPVIIIRADENISMLSTGLSESTPCVANVEELIRQDGFSFDLIDENLSVITGNNSLLVLALIVLVTALILSLCYFFILKPNQARYQIPEDPNEVTELYLNTVPGDDVLDRYPNLEKIIIPQSEAEKALGLLDRYTVVLK